MRGRFDSHARSRELLAARLDRPLTRAENRVLAGHLKACSACQQVDRDYREQRALLRSLPTPVPPRDMWARTSTALDREMSGWAHRYPRLGRRAVVRARRSAGAPSALATVVAALGVVTALVALQLVPTLRPIAPSTSSAPETALALNPTPFAVPPQPLTLVASGPSDVTFYETRVDQVCPQSAPDCVEDTKFVERRFSIPADVQPENATLSAAGRVAFVGHKSQSDVIAVVLLLTEQAPGDPSPSVRPTRSAPPSATPTASQETLPPESAVVSTATPSRETEPPVMETAEPSPIGPATPTPDATADPPTDSPTPTTSTVTPTDGVGPTPTADETPSVEPEPSETPDATATPALHTPSTLETPAPETPTPPASAVPGLTVLSILEDVHSAGAPPAWSRDGEVLAFSAMPADGSHGPDVYVWQPGDSTARAVTTDHASFFASWSGGRIVVSRVAATADESDAPQLQTVVIDLDTLEQRAVGGPEMWLPVVDPHRSHAIVWHGTLDLTGPLPEAQQGALYVVDWTALNPFRADEEEAPPDETQETGLAPLDPSRDPEAEPVLDWHARWSPDGTVLGVWEADKPNESWGDLVLVALDPESGSFNFEDPLLDPVFAKRGFMLDTDRVAWVGPPTVGREGELHIRTWGMDGVGDLRIESLKLQELVPSF